MERTQQIREKKDKQNRLKQRLLDLKRKEQDRLARLAHVRAAQIDVTRKQEELDRAAALKASEIKARLETPTPPVVAVPDTETSEAVETDKIKISLDEVAVDSIISYDGIEYNVSGLPSKENGYEYILTHPDRPVAVPTTLSAAELSSLFEKGAKLILQERQTVEEIRAKIDTAKRADEESKKMQKDRDILTRLAKMKGGTKE